MDAGIAVIRLGGELEVGRKDEVRDALTLGPSEGAVLLDFAEVTYADSTALAEILRFRNAAAERNIPVALVVASRQFARLIEYAGLADALPVFEDRGEALSRLARERKT